MPSCSQLLLTLVAHRIWPGRSSFATMMFSRQNALPAPPTPTPVLSSSFCCILCLLNPHFWSVSAWLYSPMSSVCLFLLWLGVLALSEAYQCSLRTGMQKDLIYVHTTPHPPAPLPPPLLECWLFYQHPNVEFWSNSLCVPNIASGHCGDVFMTKTLIAVRRKSARVRGMVCISGTFLTGRSSLLLAWSGV